jgi:hypothetical protein
MRGALALAASISASGSAPAQTAPEVLAAQIRAQGYQCEPPLSAERDARQSKPDEAVWILKCKISTFRVRLDPDMAAHVDEIK